jgi:hypothetical protein
MAINPNAASTSDPTRRPIAARLAYGGNSQPDDMYSYRLSRGFPFQRAGQPVAVSATFNSLKLNTGSAVGLHGPVNQSALSDGLVDPARPGFAQKGSNVPTFVTVAFTFNAGSPTTLTISWPATALRRANRTLVTSGDTAVPAGSISITGLTANTTYWYYPFWSEAAQVVGWAGAGNSTSAGSPAIAQTLQTDAVLQFASFQGFVPLNTLEFTQPAAGASTATGGYTCNLNITGGGRSYKIF